MFGKAGRPPEDRFVRKLEIFEAVAPLILTVGARHLSMRQAARAACLSVGGLYHYFPTKRDLVLYALQPDVLEQRCQDFHSKNRALAAQNPRRYFDRYVDFAVCGVCLWQPAIQAALELGVETFRDTVDWALNLSAERFRDMKRLITPDVSEETLDQLEYSLRRVCLAACLDKRITPDALRTEICALFDGYATERDHQGSEDHVAPENLSDIPTTL
jgi:AcrR family transcriptional regulator